MERALPQLENRLRVMRQKSPFLRPIRNDLAAEFHSALAEYTNHVQRHVNQRPELARALVADAFKRRASDIHLEPRALETRIRFRIDGAVVDVANLTHEQAKWLLNQFKAVANLDPVARFTPKDSHARCRLEGYDIDLRLALAPSQHGEALSVRILDPKRLERFMDDLGMAPRNLQRLETWLENVSGMFLAAGPTGCGKTTTVYSLLHELKFADRTIVSLEDPVEYEVDGITQMQLDEKHHLNFAEGVKSVLRLDPDFLMMGEIRDSASAKAAVDAAITGRVLLSTIHSRDAVGVVTALRNWGLADHEISEALSVVVSQRLVRRLCRECREKAAPADGDVHWLNSLGLPVPGHIWRAVGCSKCSNLGYVGRTGVFELWELGEKDYELILGHADEHTIRQHLVKLRHSSLLEDGIAKLADGTTTFDELKRASNGAFASERRWLSNNFAPDYEPKRMAAASSHAFDAEI
jgi:general secretion pathway protein E